MEDVFKCANWEVGLLDRQCTSQDCEHFSRLHQRNCVQLGPRDDLNLEDTFPCDNWEVGILDRECQRAACLRWHAKKVGNCRWLDRDDPLDAADTATALGLPEHEVKSVFSAALRKVRRASALLSL